MIHFQIRWSRGYGNHCFNFGRSGLCKERKPSYCTANNATSLKHPVFFINFSEAPHIFQDFSYLEIMISWNSVNFSKRLFIEQKLYTDCCTHFVHSQAAQWDRETTCQWHCLHTRLEWKNYYHTLLNMSVIAQ